MAFYFTLFSDENNKSKLKSDLSDQQVFQGGLYDVGVESVFLKGAQIYQNSKVLRDKTVLVYLEESQERQKCICEYVQDYQFIRFKRVIFHPLSFSSIHSFHIALKKLNGEDIKFDKHESTVVKIIVKPSNSKMRYLRFSSLQEKDLYFNTPLHFTSTLAYQWTNVDMSDWEIALHSIFVPKLVLAKLNPNITVLNIYTNVKLQGQLMTNLLFSLDDIPVKMKEINSLNFYYETPSLKYHSFESSFFHNISFVLRANFSMKDAQKLTENQLKSETIISFCLRHKYE